MLTPEILARAVVAESDWRECELASGELDFDRLRAHIAAALRAYAAQERALERAWIAMYLEGRAKDVAAENTNAAQWMARIFRDEAAAIRASPTQED